MQDETINPGDASAESSAPATDVAPVTDTGAEASGEPSRQTMLEAVLEVVKPTNQDGEAEQEGEKAEDVPTSEETAEEEGQTEAGKEETEDDEAPAKAEWSAEARKKVNRLLRQRRELKNELQQLQAMQPVAEIGAQLQTFTAQHDLSGDDVVNALHIAATLRRGDYASFYEMVAPFVRHAQEYLGVVLPNDLQQMVDQQQIAPEVAREFARTRFDQQRMQIENTRMNDMGRQYVTTQVKADVGRVVSDFESQLAARDPDYKAKAGFVQRAAGDILRARGGSITNAQEAIDIVKEAYDEVNTHFRKMAPTPKATARSPAAATQQQTPQARPAPKNMLEAIQAGLSRARA